MRPRSFNAAPAVPAKPVTLAPTQGTVNNLPTSVVHTAKIAPAISEFKHISVAYDESLAHMKARAAGLNPSLKTPWQQLNEWTLDGIPWQSIVILAARPSHGKTLTVTQLTRQSFALNPTQEFSVLDFQFEMVGKMMGMREMSMALRKGLKYLNNAEKGNKLTNVDLQAAYAYAKANAHLPVYYDDDPRTVADFKKRVLRFYEATGRKPIIVTLDHTILLKKARTQETINELLYALGEVMTEIKKMIPVIFIILTQLNRDCEKVERLKNGTIGNYIASADVFGADALHQHADLMLALNMPARMGLVAYGPHRYEVHKDLLAGHVLKNRNGEVGDLFFKADFANMRIEPWPGVNPAQIPASVRLP